MSDARNRVAGPDRHADERERKARKARYGMRVSGRSVRLLARLAAQPKKQRKSQPQRQQKRKRRSR